MCQMFEASKSVEPPLQPIFRPERTAMERVGVDIFHFGGNTFLLMVGAFRNYPLMKKFGNASSTDKVIKQASKWFDTFGYPLYVRHDSGGEFRTRFVEYLRQVGVRSELSSAYNSPSNGRCERSVGQVKAKECFYTALAEWRLAPRSDGPSPTSAVL